VDVHESEGEPRALFLFSDRMVEGDDRVCSGKRPSLLDGKPCPFSQLGRIPHPLRVKEIRKEEIELLGLPDDLAPACAINQLGALYAWEERLVGADDPALKSLRLFKCSQMFLFVIPGLHDESPDRIIASADA
jgi:hypothetical protein